MRATAGRKQCAHAHMNTGAVRRVGLLAVMVLLVVSGCMG